MRWKNNLSYSSNHYSVITDFKDVLLLNVKYLENAQRTIVANA